MELMIVITVLCFSLSLLQTPGTAASLQIQQEVLRSHGKVNGVDDDQLSLPRKLRFTAEVTKQVQGHGGDQNSMTDDNKVKVKEDAPAAGNMVYNKKQGEVMHGSRSNNKKGTRAEWVERGGDISQYFTMDYSHVKRRRPIHNKSLPVGP
ncbi:hypothetical protein OWV82_016848 [Melia azedarach]|uniref:Uncharacterized protein n=1 Tax=Melia azedarach TaxID=155640 RepID=A0ACC1XGY9_MELAZ|nr:hypothetical protein OWV82_016848 [Melia azedarach]